MHNQPELTNIAREFSVKNKLQVLEFAGKGAFKETYCVVDEKKNKIALKLISSKKYNPSRSKREINALLKCDTSLIGKIYDFGEFAASDSHKYYFSLEEYLDGGTLTDKISDNILTIDLIKKYSITLVQAVEYLRTKNLVHRDIKPDNIMFRSNADEPVLVDLGIVRDLNETSLTQSWLPQGPGTPFFSSPEQLNNDKNLIDWRSDQFSLGIVLGICLTNKHPFEETGMNEWDVVQSMANRNTCSKIFENKIGTFGLKKMVKMIAPWPIERHQRVEDLTKIFI